MTIEELKDSGAIYFEKITEGMQQYDNQIVRMNEYQAVDKFTELWEACGCNVGNARLQKYVCGFLLFYASTGGKRTDRQCSCLSGTRICSSDGT